MLSRSARPLQRFACKIQGRQQGSAFLKNNCNATSRPLGFASRHSSAKSDNEDKKEENVKESLQDTVRRMQQKDGKDAAASNDFAAQGDDLLRKARQTWSTFSDEVSKTWEELLRSGERKDINKKLTLHHPEDTADGDKPFIGSVEIMVIDEKEHLTAWERMQRRLTEAPIISGTQN
jgi:hypothetical protein